MDQRPFKIYGVSRVYDNNKVIHLSCSATPTDEELRSLHEYLNGWVNHRYETSKSCLVVKDGKIIKHEPCGECHIKPGEICDICGAAGPPTDTPLFEGMTFKSHIMTHLKILGGIALLGFGWYFLLHN